MLKNYFKIALRNFIKQKGYSAINVTGLAVGIALCLLILIYVKHELSYDSFHENANRIVRVNMVDNEDQRVISVTPSMVAPSLGFEIPDVEKWVRLYEPTRYNPIIIKTGDDTFQENSFLYADSSFFNIFSFRFINGDQNSALKNPESLVLTESTALKLFGNTDVIGKTVNARIFNMVNDFTVTAVIKDMPSNSHFRFDYIGSMHTMAAWSQLTDTEIRSANFYTYLLLTSPNSLENVQARVNEFVNKQVKEQRNVSLNLLPLKELFLNSENTAYEIAPMGSKQNIYGFIFLAFMVLLIATINYINLATARSSRRASEVGIRKALGAVRGQLIKQFYGESIILTLISVGTALVLVELFKDTFFGLMDQKIDLNLISDPATWYLLGSIVLITSLLAGSYPALLLSSYQPVKVLKGLFSTKGSDGRLRKGLVISQFAISTFLILSTAIIFKQTDFILTSNLGFDKESIVVLPARDSELAAKQDLLKSEILRQPGVLSATYMSNIPGKVFGGYTAETAPGSDRISIAAGAADPSLVETMGMELLAGEGFPDNPSYSKDQGFVYLLNETLAKSFGWTPKEAIGKPFNALGGREGEVVGVVKDFNFASLHEQVDPLALFIDADMYNYILIKIAPNSTRETLGYLSDVWKDIAPHRPFEFEFLDQQLNALYNSEIRTRNLLTLFSGLAIFIACLGLIGLSSYLIELRSKEIGIRKVLGASVSSIVTLLSADFIKLVGIGFIIGAPLAWYFMEQWLTDFAYRIDIGIAVFVFSAVIALAIALATVSIQSLKASLANPVNSLKSE